MDALFVEAYPWLMLIALVLVAPGIATIWLLRRILGPLPLQDLLFGRTPDPATRVSRDWLALRIALRGAAIGLAFGTASMVLLGSIGFLLSFITWSNRGPQGIADVIVGCAEFVGTFVVVGGVTGFIVGLFKEFRPRHRTHDKENSP